MSGPGSRRHSFRLCASQHPKNGTLGLKWRRSNQIMETSGGGELWWWAASSGQLAAGVALYRRGCGSGAAMPFMAFAISTLIIGAGAAAGAGALHSSGIHTVDDMKEVGKCIRRWIQVPPGETN